MLSKPCLRPLLLACLLASCAAPQSSAPAQPPASRLGAIPDQAVKRTPEQDPHPPVLHAAGWSEPVPLPGPINTAGAEDSPFMTPDGQMLFFFFTPDASIPAQEQLTDGVTGIYLSRRQGDTWGEPQRLMLQDPGQLALDGCPFFQDDLLWFCSARSGNFRDIDLWTAVLQGAVWGEWQNAGRAVNLDRAAGEMHLSADGSQMLFHRQSETGQCLDLWAMERQADGWSEPRNLVAVNSAGDEGWPFLSQDGQELWFTRIHQGSPAIFRSGWAGSDWGEPELIVSTFAGEPTLDNAGQLIFVHHYFEQGRMIEADLYVAYRMPE